MKFAISAFIAAGVLSATALEMETGGDYVIEASGAMTIDGDMSVPSDAAVTNHPWYCPSGEFVAFRNVNVEDIESVSVLWAHRGGLNRFNWRWLTSWAVTDDEDGRWYDLQHLEGSLWGGRIRLSQSGSDVIADIEPCWRWGTGKPACESLWTQMSQVNSMGITNNAIHTAASSGDRFTAWRNLSCKLKTPKKSVPERIVFRNTRQEGASFAKDSRLAFHDGSFTSDTYVPIWKNTRLSWLKWDTLTAKLGGTKVGSKWTTAEATVGTSDATEGTNIIFEVGSSPLFGVKVNFKQIGEDVCAKVVFARHVYGQALGFDFSKGVDISFSGTVDGAELAISDFAAEWTPPDRMERTDTCSDWIFWPDQIAFRDMDPADILSVSAMLAGSALYSRDNHVIGINTKIREDGALDNQFQYKSGSAVYNISVRLERQGEDVRATPDRVAYSYGVEVGEDFDSRGSPRDLTNTIKGAHVSLHYLSVVREWKYPVPVTVQAFDSCGLPVSLKNVDLHLAPAAAQSAVLSGGIYGFGRVVKEGAGDAVLSSDVRTSGGIQILDGVLEVSGARKVTTPMTWEAPEPVKIGADASLRFVLDADGVSSLDVTAMGVEQGATVALRADEDPGFGTETTTLTLVSGAGLAADDISKISFVSERSLLDRYSLELAVSTEGDLILNASLRHGLVISLR